MTFRHKHSSARPRAGTAELTGSHAAFTSSIPLAASVRHALAWLGLGIAGMSCGGDFPQPTPN